MREILFRAKINKTESEWVEGFYVHIPCGRFMCDEHLIQTIDVDGRIGQLYTVYESTLGQFTGLFDKNGKKIFEGDILDYWSDIRKSFCKKYETVVYGVENCGCCHSVYGWSSKDQYGYGEYIGHPESCVVVGNIHDNPELVEVV